MTVKDLINQLKKLPQDKTIVLEHTDHTDYTYSTPLTSDSIVEDEWWDESNDDETKDYDESLQDVVKIVCSFW